MVDSDGDSDYSDVVVDSDEDGSIGYGDVMAATPVDIKIYAHSYAFVLDMPGLETADVRVQVKPNNVLIISGERWREEEEGVKYAKVERYLGKMMRKFALPGDANMDKITAGCRAGVLTVAVERLPPAHSMRPTMIEAKREAVRHCGYERKVVSYFLVFKFGIMRNCGICCLTISILMHACILFEPLLCVEWMQVVGADDRISLLPNELLLCVLSFLSFKEAIATSILSHRWRYLHTFMAKLDFDGTKLLEKAENDREGFDEVRRKFLRSVDGVVRLNQCSPLEKFRVLFHLKQFASQHIDRWVRFALSRKVESLELILTEIDSWFDYYDEYEGEYEDEGEDVFYTLNMAMFTWEGVTSSNAGVYTLNLAPSDDVYNLNLKKLCTYGVNVSGETVEMLLRSCPLLEQVSIARSKHLLDLKIIEPFPSFKSLEIIMCKNLTDVVVRDSNIVTLKYTGRGINFMLQNVPLLTELCADWMGNEEDIVEMFSSVLPQLHVFKMRFVMHTPYENDVIEFCSTFHLAVEMSNLKQLVVNVGYYDDESLLPYLRLIRASPRLEKFVIEISKYCRDKFVEGEVREISAGRKIPMSYPHLKEVEFVGYRGVSNHVKVLEHFVKNAIALETIVVHPCDLESPSCDGTWEDRQCEFNAVAFERAKELKDSVPFGINVKIL